MSINTVNGVSPVSQQAASPGMTTTPPATTFGQELDAQGGAIHGRHHHAGASQSVTSSAASMASVAGVTTPETIAASLQRLLT